ncbi:MAG: DoxX family protein [Rhodocyclaceae bacterium]|nr:DoxX family protein [Rhodocyclaceae bacterium]MCP5297880.1 DoxX family protein [Zoogloeaceae bacterium]PKO66094.1 MAG: DoxX family protein [Betaproteobacteria bacterium HGW-Betaproteobacteria-14]MBX3676504.1 DoxX family protein [Rhodocyclaceae bacterium]MCB1892777.1 DoxX family protein [Rhodocyclaceae bacterium]
MNDSYKTYISVLGRLLLALMFILSGVGKLGNIQGTAAFIASGGLPAPTVLAVAVGALELFGGLALVVGYQVRLVGLALALFTVAASVVFHAYWSAPAAQQFVTQLLFMKNISVAGGMLLISALGAGPLSIDARRAAGASERYKPA